MEKELNMLAFIDGISLEVSSQTKVRNHFGFGADEVVDLGEDITVPLAQFGHDGGRYYATNNSVIGIILEGFYFATPRSAFKEKILKSLGFEKKDFYVPFSNGTELADSGDASYWEMLKAETT